MNKQEKEKLIGNVLAWGAWCNEVHTGELGRYVKISKVRELIKQLDELQKPVVRQFVADWFERNKNNLEFAIWELCVDSCNAEAEPGIIDWIQCPENNPIETLIRMKNGYEVEEEPKYYIRLTIPISSAKGLYLCFDKDDTFDTSYCKPHVTWGWKCTFTEQEIKAIDERYWPFAVPVEKV